VVATLRKPWDGIKRFRHELRAWQVLRPLLDAGPYLPWTVHAMSPAALVTILNEIAVASRGTIVECGSGISTVLIGRLLRERGGTLVSLEHDPAWAQFVRSQLELEGLEAHARLVEAPLAQHPLGLDGAPWYEEAALAELPGNGIDLLLVDGPTAYVEGMGRSRYPALPALAERLAPDAVVVLDDAARTGESAILDAWERETQFRFNLRRGERIALGQRKAP
jgi:predicted O-methyltransferase YrrM